MPVTPFRGGPQLKLDDKSRLTVPARFKDVLMAEHTKGRLVVAKNPDRCLSIFPLPVWQVLEAQLEDMKYDQNGWRRLLMGSATDVTIDGGRVLIAPELREWAGMVSRDVTLLGQGAYLELWDSESYTRHENQVLAGPRPEPVNALQIRWPEGV